jgi:hypothetical protein
MVPPLPLNDKECTVRFMTINSSSCFSNSTRTTKKKTVFFIKKIIIYTLRKEDYCSGVPIKKKRQLKIFL